MGKDILPWYLSSWKLLLKFCSKETVPFINSKDLHISTAIQQQKYEGKELSEEEFEDLHQRVLKVVKQCEDYCYPKLILVRLMRNTKRSLKSNGKDYGLMCLLGEKSLLWDVRLMSAMMTTSTPRTLRTAS